jgi:hypothetical protein
MLLPASGRVIHPYAPDTHPFDMPLGNETTECGSYRAVRESPAQQLLDNAGAHRPLSGPQGRKDRSFEFTRQTAGRRAGVILCLVGVHTVGIAVVWCWLWAMNGQQRSSLQARITAELTELKAPGPRDAAARGRGTHPAPPADLFLWYQPL